MLSHATLVILQKKNKKTKKEFRSHGEFGFIKIRRISLPMMWARPGYPVLSMICARLSIIK